MGRAGPRPELTETRLRIRSRLPILPRVRSRPRAPPATARPLQTEIRPRQPAQTPGRRRTTRLPAGNRLRTQLQPATQGRDQISRRVRHPRVMDERRLRLPLRHGSCKPYPKPSQTLRWPGPGELGCCRLGGIIASKPTPTSRQHPNSPGPGHRFGRSRQATG